jgi:hypothetical protein
MENIIDNFSSWVSWSGRESLNLSEPGIYILGYFEVEKTSYKPTLSDSLLYIGETCGQALRNRLNQFERSAFSGKSGHSGGRTFFKEFNVTSAPYWLYLSVHSVSKKEPYKSAYIRHIERALIWQYVHIHKKLPKCNRK